MLAWGTGISVSVPNFKDTSVPFPCQDHGCSCRNARGCWNHCCCQTRTEKLAWAEKHGVTPPDYFLAAGKSSDTATSETVANEAVPEFCGESVPAVARLDDRGRVCTSAKAPHSSPLASVERGSEGGCGSCGSGHAKAEQKTEPDLPYSRYSVANDFRCHGVGSVDLFFTPVLELKPHCNALVNVSGQRLNAPAFLAPPSWDAPPESPPPRV